MTTPTSEDPFPPQYPVMQEAPAPFEDFVVVELTKPVNQEQLTDEINKAAKANATLAISGPANGNEAISPENPAELYVSPSRIGKEIVNKAVSDHDMDVDFAVPEAERAFQAVLQKVISDPTAELTDDEMRAGVHGLLIRQANSGVISSPA